MAKVSIQKYGTLRHSGLNLNTNSELILLYFVFTCQLSVYTVYTHSVSKAEKEKPKKQANVLCLDSAQIMLKGQFTKLQNCGLSRLMGTRSL